MATPLLSLLDILSSGIHTIESTYAKAVQKYPSLDQPWTPGALDEDPAVVDMSRLVVAAAYQVIATIRTPAETLQASAGAMYDSVTLNLVLDVHIPDVLKDAGDEGLHVKDLSTLTGVAPDHLAHMLRYLATRHIFREVKPDVFANNRISSALMKKHSLEEIKKQPEIAYEGAGCAAVVGHTTDEGLKSAVSIVSFVKDKTGKYAAPFNMAFATNAPLFEWLSLPDNHNRFRRATAAMTGGGEQFPTSIFTSGFDWKSLKESAVVVDVGGSVGSVTYSILQENPHLRFIVQDMESVIVHDAPKWWDAKMPSAIKDGRVQLQVSNFFEEQPVHGAAVYFMRCILHDWPDNRCMQILKVLRAAAAPSSRLVVFEMIMTHACAYDGPFADVSSPVKAPAPLLANLGVGGAGFMTMVDMQMLNFFNSKERTVSEFMALGKATGWKLEAVKAGMMGAMVFSPA